VKGLDAESLEFLNNCSEGLGSRLEGIAEYEALKAASASIPEAAAVLSTVQVVDETEHAFDTRADHMMMFAGVNLEEGAPMVAALCAANDGYASAVERIMRWCFAVGVEWERSCSE